ncbi:cysteine-rich repeat secretory protein 38-like [Nymphaea colorata]|uniref:cysteine-rich repeat secretory protein 38-like n=1 Tax=Nymphaea colorata TaxID=210225 RepID=UPI00129DCA4B|nr:cysteine-rich repeat secretory protein 38-like [Nymphaea colorata]
MGYSVMVLRMKIGFPLLVLFLLLSFRVDPAMSSNDYIDSYCNTDINYIDGSEFQTNMRLAFATLIADVNPLGFSNATQGEGSDRVYAMAQCRGDVGQNTCKECIDTSTQKVNDTDCTHPMEAIIWYENCQLRYSNTDFFGILDVAHSGYNSWNDDVVADESFNEQLGSLLQNLTSLATTPREPASKLMFATGNILYTDLQTIYGLVQCTGDTSVADCKQCLDTTRSQIPTTEFCDHSTGCEIVTGSCRLRYDTKLFYETTTTSIPSPPPPPADSSPSPSLPPNSAPLSSPEPSVLTPPPNSAPVTSNTTTSDKRNHSSGTSVAIITIITFAFTTTDLLAMPSWL